MAHLKPSFAIWWPVFLLYQRFNTTCSFPNWVKSSVTTDMPRKRPQLFLQPQLRLIEELSEAPKPGQKAADFSYGCFPLSARNVTLG